MNAAQAHLVVNHFPVFAVLFGLVALAWAAVRSSPEMRRAAIALFVAGGLFSLVALQTGDGAEEAVEDLPGISEATIHEHEEAAELANVFAVLLSITSAGMGAAFARRASDRATRSLAMSTVALAVITCVLLARAAHFGGQIRHPEIRRDATRGSSTGSRAHDDHDRDEDDLD